MVEHSHASRSNVAQEAADWHARLRGELLSELERARFRAWLAGASARRQEFDDLSALWDELEEVAQSPEVLAVQRKITERGARHRASRQSVLGWALAAGVACVAGSLAWQTMAGPQSYSTGVGEYRTVPLADGSVITLNTLSQMDVRFTDGERVITLVHGQASFEVAKDPARPFIVRASGRSPVRSVANLEQASAWRHRKLDFRETPLAMAIAEANRHSNLKIELRAADLADARISGIFQAGRNDALASALQAFFDLNVERHGEDLIVLTRKTR